MKKKHLPLLALGLVFCMSAGPPHYRQAVRQDFQRWNAPSENLDTLKDVLENGASPEVYVPLFCSDPAKQAPLRFKDLEILGEQRYRDLDADNQAIEAVWLKTNLIMETSKPGETCQNTYFLKYVLDKSWLATKKGLRQDQTRRWIATDLRFNQQRQWRFRFESIDPKVQSEMLTQVRDRLASISSQYAVLREFQVRLETHTLDSILIVTAPPYRTVPDDFIETITQNAQLQFKYKNAQNQWVDGGIKASALKDARPNLMYSNWIVEFELNSEGARRFGELTTQLVGKSLGIFVDGKLISAPNITSPITGGSGYISGNFSAEDAKNLARTLSFKPLLAPLSFVDESLQILNLQVEALAAANERAIVE